MGVREMEKIKNSIIESDLLKESITDEKQKELTILYNSASECLSKLQMFIDELALFIFI